MLSLGSVIPFLAVLADPSIFGNHLMSVQLPKDLEYLLQNSFYSATIVFVDISSCNNSALQPVVQQFYGCFIRTDLSKEVYKLFVSLIMYM